jgi:hypothetical protein
MLLLLIVTQVIGQEATAGLETILGRVGMWSPGVAAAVCGLLLVAVVWSGYLVTQAFPRPGRGAEVVVGMLAFFAVVLSNAVPGWGFKALGIESWSMGRRAAVFAALAAVWAGLWHWVLPRVQQWFQTPIDLAAQKRPDPPAGPVTLIAIVSRIRPDEFSLAPDRTTATLTRGQGDRAKTYPLTFASLAHDIEALQGSEWSWQQLLRAVHRYAPRSGLKIVLVGSKTTGGNDRGSHEQLAALCKPFLERYPELRGTTVEVLPQALDFEEFNAVKDAIRACIRDECRRVEETNVFVDITGGQKVASAAAAAATIGTSGHFQYVRTNDPYDVVVSDLHPQAVPSAGA